MRRLRDEMCEYDGRNNYQKSTPRSPNDPEMRLTQQHGAGIYLT